MELLIMIPTNREKRLRIILSNKFLNEKEVLGYSIIRLYGENKVSAS